MLNEKMKLNGAMTATLKHENGDVEVFHKNNMIVDVGFDFVADALCKANSRPNPLSHIAVGTGTDAVIGTQTSLSAELTRLAATYSHTVGTKAFTLTATFDAGVATGPITEAGVFNDAVDGIMLDRVMFPVVNKQENDILDVVFTFTMA